MDTSQVDAVENEPLVIAATAVASGRFDLELSHCLLDRLLLIGGLDGPEIGSTEQRGISHVAEASRQISGLRLYR